MTPARMSLFMMSFLSKPGSGHDPPPFIQQSRTVRTIPGRLGFYSHRNAAAAVVLGGRGHRSRRADQAQHHGAIGWGIGLRGGGGHDAPGTERHESCKNQLLHRLLLPCCREPPWLPAEETIRAPRFP